MNRILFLTILMGVLLLIDWYAFQGIKAASSGISAKSRQVVTWIYWSLTALTIFSFVFYYFTNPYKWGRQISVFLSTAVFAQVLGKVFLVLFVFADDIRRGFIWIADKIGTTAETAKLPGESIPRSEFLAKTGIIIGSVPIVAVGYGILSGAHDYRVLTRKIPMKGLPKAFEGMRIAQVSDIHTGSFWNKRAVVGGVELINQQKADVVFFTGDLVNNVSNEMKGWKPVFDKIKAPLGVYSVLGNHDYGDYVSWDTPQAKQKNLDTLIQIHKDMGWDILINENRILKVDGEELAILGVENWGAKARFPKYGDLAKAKLGTEDIQNKILLSHDPSHWKAQVIDQNPDIDLTLSGHTHGMQFGIEIGDFKWSPVQYMYEEWADHYSHNHQHIYVNRGFGYLGLPGRIGIPPEITILELTAA